MPFSRRLCARALPVRSKQMTAELDLRQKPPVVEPGAIKILHGKASSLRGAKRRSNPESAAVTLDCFAPLAMTKRKAERRQTLCNNLRASRRGTAPKGRLACRRSTTALAAATERHRSARATRLPGTCSERPPRWFERRSASQRTTQSQQPASMRHSRALPAPCCPSPARLHPQTGHDAGRACLAQTAREPR
jgi:hypothetical protein